MVRARGVVADAPHQPAACRGCSGLAGALAVALLRPDPLARIARRLDDLASSWRDRYGPALVREDAYVVLEVDTLAATRASPAVLDVVTRFGGPGNGLRVLGVGGGTLELSLNGGDWFAASSGDTVEHFLLDRLAVRATTPAAGTARLWVAGRARRE